MNEPQPASPAVDPDYAASLEAGFVESYEDYCARLAEQQPAPDEEATP